MADFLIPEIQQVIILIIQSSYFLNFLLEILGIILHSNW